MNKLRIHLWSGLRRFVDGEEVVEVEATTIGTMLDALKAEYPGLAPLLDAGVSIAIDDEIVNGSRHRPLNADQEIFVLQKIKGG